MHLRLRGLMDKASASYASVAMAAEDCGFESRRRCFFETFFPKLQKCCPKTFKVFLREDIRQLPEYFL